MIQSGSPTRPLLWGAIHFWGLRGSSQIAPFSFGGATNVQFGYLLGSTCQIAIYQFFTLKPGFPTWKRISHVLCWDFTFGHCCFESVYLSFRIISHIMTLNFAICDLSQYYLFSYSENSSLPVRPGPSSPTYTNMSQDKLAVVPTRLYVNYKCQA